MRMASELLRSLEEHYEILEQNLDRDDVKLNIDL